MPKESSSRRKKTKKGISIIEEKTITDSAKTATEKHIEKLMKQKVYRAMRRNECSNASFVKSTVISKLIVVIRTIAVIRIKMLKTRTSRHQSQCSSLSEVL